MAVPGVRVEGREPCLSSPRTSACRSGASPFASARILLRDLLVRAGCEVSLVTVHLWPRPWQGTAYLWARRTLDGDVSLAPYHVRFVMAEAERSKTVRST